MNDVNITNILPINNYNLWNLRLKCILWEKQMFNKKSSIMKTRKMNKNLNGKTLTLILTMLFVGLNLSFTTGDLPDHYGNHYYGSQEKGNIKGTLTEVESGDPVYYADILIFRNNTLAAITNSKFDGSYSIMNVPVGSYNLKIKKTGYETIIKKGILIEAGKTIEINIELEKTEEEFGEPAEPNNNSERTGLKGLFSRGKPAKTMECSEMGGVAYDGYNMDIPYIPYNTESYDLINENIFKDVLNNPLSTFSIDVDRASYSNIRRFLNMNTMPYKDAVRIEEMINYFDYDYPQPNNGDPFSVSLEMGECPWNKEHQLVMIGIQGEDLSSEEIPPTNLVFLLDVSGSMDAPNKLPLLKQAFKLLVNNLRSEDRVAIVVYAGAAGLVLESTPGDDKSKIINALDMLQAGGSTAGGKGIKLAYKIAKENYIPGGNNRVILATDGDFNIGASSDAEMTRLIEKKRKEGVFLSILGFGMGNYKDSKMEQMSNAGNGNYAYIDNIMEAKKVFGEELWGTLYTIAKDVKIQIEFNPAKVKAYRLIGYENRILNKEDFNDDKKDAGDIGCGHTVTALYEIVPAGSDEEVSNVDPLEYQTVEVKDSKNLMTLKLRYKEPDGETSKLIVHKVQIKDIKNGSPSDNLKFATAVAQFGMLLRNSGYKANSGYDQTLALAKEALGNDAYNYRSEFIRLVETAQLLTK